MKIGKYFEIKNVISVLVLTAFLAAVWNGGGAHGMIYTSRAAELPVETVQETPDPEATVITDATADIAADSADNITIEDLFSGDGVLAARYEDARAEALDADPADVPVDEASVEDTNEDEYASFAIADVTNYVNVRTEPNTDSEVAGKIYDGAVAQILSVAGEGQDWFQIVSGNVEGYIKAEFFIYGDAAAAVVDDYVTRYATVQADRLNVREEMSTDAKRIGYIDNGEKVKILEDSGDWLKVQYTEEKSGYVAAEYVTVSEEFIYAKTLEEEAAEPVARQALQERETAAEQDTPELITNITLPSTTYTSNEELRQGIIDYAMQYLGNRYVHGGSSLESGTDCSGFTCFVYAQFGYSISRTPGGQYSSAGRSISSEELQPGDIVCYSSNGGKSCTHVGLYIGDGQIIHSANSRKGVIISAVDYSPVIGMRNVID